MEKDNCQEQMKQPYFQDWFTKHVIFQESIFCKRFLASFHLFCSAKTLFCLLNKMGQGFSCSTSAFWKSDILEGIFTKKSHVFCNMFALRCVPGHFPGVFRLWINIVQPVWDSHKIWTYGCLALIILLSTSPKLCKSDKNWAFY